MNAAPPRAARPITARPSARATVRVRSAPVRHVAQLPFGTSARPVGRPSARVSDFASRDPSSDTRPRARDTLEHVGVGLEAPSACATPHLRPSAPCERPSNHASARMSAAHPRVQRIASRSAGCSRASPAASRASPAASRVSAARAGLTTRRSGRSRVTHPTRCGAATGACAPGHALGLRGFGGLGRCLLARVGSRACDRGGLRHLLVTP